MKMRPNAGQSHGGANEGWAVITTLIGGFAVWGGIGWLLDRWLGTSFLVAVGLIIGMALGIYAVVARFGAPAAPSEPAVKAPQSQAPPTQAPQVPSDGQPPADTRRETECQS